MQSNHELTATIANLENVRVADLVTFSEPDRGSLTVVHCEKDIPFSIARLFYMYGFPKDCERGAHAHRAAEQAFIAISGRFSLDVTNSLQSKTYLLKERNRTVYVPPMIWARVHNFSEDAVCLVLTNTSYDPDDYIRDWDEYLAATRGQSR
jgi:dTDP-4-dehydrorhamnose 3,5-epimerase-like enzyme